MAGTAPIRMLIVDDHPVVRHGLQAAVGDEQGLQVVGAVATLEQALEFCRSDPPDVILRDLRLPGTLPERAVAQLRAAHANGREPPHSVPRRQRTGAGRAPQGPDTPPRREGTRPRAEPAPGGGPGPERPRILLLSTDEAGDDLCRALEAGAAGGLSRTAEPGELIEALRSIHAGAAWLSVGLAERCEAYRAGPRLGEEELPCLRLRAAVPGRWSPRPSLPPLRTPAIASRSKVMKQRALR